MLKTFFLAATALVSACFVGSIKSHPTTTTVVKNAYSPTYKADKVSVRECTNGDIIIVPEGGEAQASSFYLFQVNSSYADVNQDLENVTITDDGKSLTLTINEVKTIYSFSEEANFSGYGLSYITKETVFKEKVQPHLAGGGKLPSDDILPAVCGCVRKNASKKPACSSGGEESGSCSISDTYGGVSNGCSVTCNMATSYACCVK